MESQVFHDVALMYNSSATSLEYQPVTSPAPLTYYWAEHLVPFWLQGPDALDLLHRRSSNAVNSLAVGQGQGNALLDRKAHVQAFISTHRLNEETLLLVTERATTELAEGEVLKYKIMERMELQKAATDTATLLLRGPGWEDALQEIYPNLIPTTGYHDCRVLEAGDTPTEALIWVRQPVLWLGRSPQEGGLLIGPRDELNQLLTRLLEQMSLDAQELTPQAYEAFRIEAGILKAGVDWNESTLLPSTALETWTVSYTKGCYLGQETVARVKTYGAVPQLFIGLEWPPADNTPSLQDLTLPLSLTDPDTGKSMGQLTSVVYSEQLSTWLGLAYLGKAYRVPGSSLRFQLEDRAFEATVRLLPFITGKRDGETVANLDKELAAAMQLFLGEQPDDGLRLLRQLIEANPTSCQARETLGVLLGRLDRYEEAIGVMKELLTVDPNWVMAYTNLSRFALALGDKEQAEVYKAEATTVAMRVAMQKKFKAANAGKPESEEKSADAPSPLVVGQPPINPEITPERKQLLEDRIQLFLHAIKFNDKDPLAHFGIAGAYAELEHWDKAIPSYEKTIELQPKHSQAYQQLGQALEASGQPMRARAVYEKGVEVASERGDLTPLQAMQAHLENLKSMV